MWTRAAHKLVVATMALVLAFGGAGMTAGMQIMGAAEAAATIERAGPQAPDSDCAEHRSNEMSDVAACCSTACHIAIMADLPSAFAPEAFAGPAPTPRPGMVAAAPPHRLDRPPKS